MNNIFDVIIIGAGVIGSSIARYLTRFKLNLLIIEKHNDVGEETTNANSAIVHAGYDPMPNTLKAKFNVLGCKMMKGLCEELDVPYIQNGSLVVAFNDEEVSIIKELKKRGDINGCDTRIIEGDELFNIEPNLNKDAKCGLFAKEAGIVSPFNLCVSLMENAIDNGASLNLNEEVIDIKKIDGFYHVFTNKGQYKTKVLINATGTHSDKITSLLEKPRFHIVPKKGEYILLDHFSNSWIKHTLFMCPTSVGKGVLVSPTTSYNYIIGPSNTLCELDDTSTDSETFKYLKETASKLVSNIPYNQTIREFAGIRANSSIDDFIIEESKENENFFNVSGIMSPGLASSPKIGEYVSSLVAKKLSLDLNESFNPKVRKHIRFNDSEEFNEIIKENKSYGHMICRCEKVSEGEIVDVIHRNCGATTVKGVKKRCRAGFGKCQGTFCQEDVIKILARELKKDINEIKYSEGDSIILKYDSKGELNG